MQIQPIKSSPSFGIYIKTIKKPYGKVDIGAYKGYSIEIYTAYDKELIRHKLYYVKDKTGKWLKSRLDFYINGKKTSTARADNVDKNFSISG